MNFFQRPGFTGRA